MFPIALLSFVGEPEESIQDFLEECNIAARRNCQGVTNQDEKDQYHALII